MGFFSNEITKSWLFDVVAVILLVLAIYLISNLESLQQEVLAPLLFNIEYFFANYDQIFKNFFDMGTILTFLGSVLVVIFAFWRITWHLRSIDRFTSQKCPRCGNELIRVKRSSFQRTIGKILPNRQFHCKKCRWQGMRLKPIETNVEEVED